MSQSTTTYRTEDNWYLMGAVDAYYGRPRPALLKHMKKEHQTSYNRGYEEKVYGEKVDSEYE